jgi:hypothetical protein
MVLLKMARYSFDSTYPGGTKGVVNVPIPKRTNSKAKTAKKRSSTSVDVGKPPDEKRKTKRNQHLDNIRMLPVDTSDANFNNPTRG